MTRRRAIFVICGWPPTYNAAVNTVHHGFSDKVHSAGCLIMYLTRIASFWMDALRQARACEFHSFAWDRNRMGRAIYCKWC
ncbi:hypothetical protein F5141DRAFT_1156103 [Pisolithus sp. B1]|nr:hypothetical protein F5141DRAFT_1156103 [Pisolithus sp. B1]